MKKAFSLVLALIVCTVFFSACSTEKKPDSKLDEYLGDYSYSDPAVCMVYEPVEDEVDDNGNQFYGIQYRQITDLDGLLNSGTVIMIYFYSSMSSEAAAVTAVVEDLAQNYNGRLTVVMLDAMEYRDYITKYEIEAVPEFVLLKPGQSFRKFDSMSYEYWTGTDVVLWLKSNGIT